jgi:hypothetical protein
MCKKFLGGAKRPDLQAFEANQRFKRLSNGDVIIDN